MNFVAIDFETAVRHHICAVGIVTVENGEIIALHTGKSVDKVAQDCDRDKWLTAIEAKEYGLVDEVLLTNPKKEKK